MPKFAEMQEDENTESDEDEPAVQVKGNKSAKSTFQMLSLDSDEQVAYWCFLVLNIFCS